MAKFTSEKVPVSLFSRVDFPTDGKPTRPTLASPTLLTSNPACAAKPQTMGMHCKKGYDVPPRMASQWRTMGIKAEVATLPSPLPPPPPPVLGSKSSRLSFANLACSPQTAQPQHQRAVPTRMPTPALCLMRALQRDVPGQAGHQQACPEGVLTFSIPRWPAVALFFWVLAICRHFSNPVSMLGGHQDKFWSLKLMHAIAENSMARL